MRVINRRRPLGRQNQAWGRPFRLNKKSWQSKGLVGWWPTLRGERIIRDLSGYGNHATYSLAANPGYAQHDVVGRAVILTGGVNEYFSTSQPQQLPTGSAARSMFGWAYVTDSPAHMPVFGYGNQSVDGAKSDLLVLSTDVVYFAGHNRDYSSGITLTWNTWYHLGYVYGSGASTVTIYINGKSYSGSIGGALATVGTTVKFSYDVLEREFYGHLADIRLYNRALTAEEAQELYNPQTRWDLYEPIPRVFPVAPLGAAALSVNVSPGANYVQIV